MHRITVIFLILSTLFVPFAAAQVDIPKSDRAMHPLQDVSHLLDTVEPYEFHLALGSAYVSTGFGSASLFAVAPSLTLRPTDRLKVNATIGAVNSFTMSPGGYRLHGQQPRTLVPLRDPSSLALGGSVSASYRVNDRLWVAAALSFVEGQLAPGVFFNPWTDPRMPVDLSATAFTAAMRYRFRDDSYLDIHMTFIDDRTGALGPLLFGGPYGSPAYYRTTTFGGHLF